MTYLQSPRPTDLACTGVAPPAVASRAVHSAWHPSATQDRWQIATFADRPDRHPRAPASLGTCPNSRWVIASFQVEDGNLSSQALSIRRQDTDGAEGLLLVATDQQKGEIQA